MKAKLSILLGLLFLCQSLTSQSFLNPLNTWYVDACASDIDTGATSCFTKEYHFVDAFTEGSKVYKRLIPGIQPSSSLPQYYREENKKVYILDYNVSEEEFLLYDFSLEVGDQAEIGTESFNLDASIEVLSVDSIELNSGEKRKRMEIGRLPSLHQKTYWIEGIGSEISPFDSRFMFFSLDVFWELNCYYYDTEIEYSIKDCELTPTTSLEETIRDDKLSVFPNPCIDRKLNFQSNQMNEINRIEIYSANGQLMLRTNEIFSNEIDINNLSTGIYFLKIGYQNNKYELAKFIKN